MPKYHDSEEESDDESFVTLGTPLSTYAHDEVPVRKPVAVHDQSVTDAQGRVRFHGAFTGGFSAGYFNTVSSKEGWAPKTFVSSRAQRTEVKGQSQRPEDYMDDEDFSEFGIAPKKIATTDNFSSLPKVNTKSISSASASQYLADLVVPKRIPIGMQLLRKLGWRDGQGVGPRTKEKKRRKRKVPAQKTYGCALPPEFSNSSRLSDEDSSDDENSYPDNVTFAPKDVCPISFEPKNNLHGIGYRGLDPKLSLGHVQTVNTAVAKRPGHRGIMGQAFGVGALEEDDDDIYSVDSMANYDQQLGDPVALESFNSKTSLRNTGPNPDVKAICGAETVLSGFQKRTDPQRPKPNYSPPAIPRDYQPFHKFSSDTPAEGSSVPSAGAVPSAGTRGAKRLDAYDRGSLLGEAPHLNSIFELVSGEDKAKMAAVKMQADLQQLQKERATVAVPEPTDSAPSTLMLPSHSSSSLPSAEVTPSSGITSARASGGFQPFAKNVAKQKRYEQYLDSVHHKLPYVPEDCAEVRHMTEWEREREKEEFVQAARLFRPLSSMITSRFTRAKYDDDDREKKQEEEVEKSSQDKAAQMKMFGKMTREKLEWHPERMLCVRFNIANPYPSSQIVGLLGTKRDKCSIYNFLTFPSEEESLRAELEAKEAERRDKLAAAAETGSSTTRPLKPLAILSSVDLRPGSSDMEAARLAAAGRSVTLAGDARTVEPSTSHEADVTSVPLPSVDGERPPMDLFKAIFEDSSDSEAKSSSEDDEAEEVKKEVKTEVLSRTEGNLQLSSAMMISSDEQTEEKVETSNERVKLEVSPDFYGPALPPSDRLLPAALPPPIALHKLKKKSSSHKKEHSRSSGSHKHGKHKKAKSKKKKKKNKKEKSKTIVLSSSSSGSEADSEMDSDEDDKKIKPTSTAKSDVNSLQRLHRSRAADFF